MIKNENISMEFLNKLVTKILRPKIAAENIQLHQIQNISILPFTILYIHTYVYNKLVNIKNLNKQNNASNTLPSSYEP